VPCSRCSRCTACIAKVQQNVPEYPSKTNNPLLTDMVHDAATCAAHYPLPYARGGITHSNMLRERACKPLCASCPSVLYMVDRVQCTTRDSSCPAASPLQWQQWTSLHATAQHTLRCEEGAAVRCSVLGWGCCAAAAACRVQRQERAPARACAASVMLKNSPLIQQNNAAAASCPVPNSRHSRPFVSRRDCSTRLRRDATDNGACNTSCARWSLGICSA
jgi:hypothetical protein